MWKGICQRLGEVTNTDFSHCIPAPLNVDCTSQAFSLDNGQHRVFIKLAHCDHWPYFATEQFALQQLAQANICRAPQVLLAEKYRTHSLLALSYLNFQPADQQQWFKLGQQLAQLHEVQQAQYGWQEDNFIGPTPQFNRWAKRWDRFYAEQRIGYQLQLLAERQIALGDIDIITNSVRQQLANHQPPCSLLHGDLWYGNVGFTEEGGWIFDPASYYGDRETDLAMTELFGSFPASFYQGYNQQWPLPDGYPQRKPLYQLYHLLNHGLLFGGSYLVAARHIIADVVACQE